MGFTASSSPADLAAAALALATAPPDAASPPGGEPPAAVCPYGFSSASSAKGKLSPLQCSLCRSYLHDCVSTVPCSHRFCR
jgi:hypothetical protein